jgi:hypothetical protein
VRLLNVRRFQKKAEELPSAKPDEILMTFQELWDNIIFEEFQMVFES